MKGFVELEDLRFKYLKDLLENDGYEMVDDIKTANFVILGIKTRLSKNINPSSLVFSFQPIHTCENVCLNDHESFLQKNAQLTSQGCLKHMDIENKKVVIFGNGRIATYLSKAMDNDVTIICRHPKEGQQKWSSLAYLDADIIINTVPARLDLNFNQLKPHVQIIDLASYPYGFDIDELRKKGFNAQLLSGIPGKYYPKQAAYIIYEEVIKCLRERKLA